jgi:hypothetical protein
MQKSGFWMEKERWQCDDYADRLVKLELFDKLFGRFMIILARTPWDSNQEPPPFGSVQKSVRIDG